MTPHLLASLNKGSAPFNGWCLHNREEWSLTQLHTVLQFTLPRLQSIAPAVFSFADWHEHDGFVLDSRETTWPAILAEIRDNQALFASRNGDDFVRNAFHGPNHQWLLRYHIGEDTDKENDCDFDLSTAKDSHYAQLAIDLLNQYPHWLTRSPAQSWFLARGC